MNEPTMNITNQINAGLNDVRKTLIDLSCVQDGTLVTEMSKARFQLDLIMDMVNDFKHGKFVPWSDRKEQVTEEFS